MTRFIINQDRDCAYKIHGTSPIFYSEPAYINGKVNCMNLMIDLSNMTKESSVTIFTPDDYDPEEKAGRICTCDSVFELLEACEELRHSEEPIVWARGYHTEVNADEMDY